MGAEIVEDNDVARTERGRELGLDVGVEHLAVERPVDHPGCGQAGATQGRDEGLTRPAPRRGLGMQTFTAWTPAPQTGELGGQRGLVDEHQPVGLKPQTRLTVMEPYAPGVADVFAALFGGPQRLFL